MRRRECEDPVIILKNYQNAVYKPHYRNLDPISTEDVLDGDTTSIDVSRVTLLDSAMEELLQSDIEYFRPLCVQFYGELAYDNGGPRREFLNLLLKALILEETRIFTKTMSGYEISQDEFNEERNWFHGAGIAFGES